MTMATPHTRAEIIVTHVFNIVLFLIEWPCFHYRVIKFLQGNV